MPTLLYHVFPYQPGAAPTAPGARSTSHPKAVEESTTPNARPRAWARRTYDQGVWAGIRWWSYYHSEWASFGLWDLRRLALHDIKVLRLDYPSLPEAARAIARRVVPRAR